MCGLGELAEEDGILEEGLNAGGELLTIIGLITAMAQAEKNGESKLDAGLKYSFGAAGAKAGDVLLKSTVVDLLASFEVTGGLAALAVCELGFACTVATESFYDFVKGLFTGGEINLVKICHDNWVSDGEAILFPLFDMLQIDKLINWWDNAGKARVAVDPLIFDLDNDGFSIIDKNSGAYFDLDNNGYRERIDWTNKDAILALDRNGNGKIDNGSELFGDTTYINESGEYAENGFAALQQYDENGDGVINSEDSVFDDLRLWIDSNGDGVSQTSELSTLAEHDITSISAVASEEKISTGTAAVIDGTSTFGYAVDYGRQLLH